MSTHARHVLHENRECSLHRVSQAAVVLDDPLVAQVLQKLDFTLQRTHLLNESRKHHIQKHSRTPTGRAADYVILTLLVSGLSGSN